MALTLINRTARRVGIACTATDTAYFYPDEGYRALTANAGHPARIMPPRGVWEVTIEGDNLYDASPSLVSQRITPTEGCIRFTRYYNGNEPILIRPTKQGATCTVVLEEAPPPCVIAFWRVWGWRCDANQNRRARHHRGGTLGTGKHAGVGRVAKTHSPLARHRNIQHGNDRRVAPTGALQGGAYWRAGAPLARNGRRGQLQRSVLHRGRDVARLLRPEPGNPPVHNPTRLTTAAAGGVA